MRKYIMLSIFAFCTFLMCSMYYLEEVPHSRYVSPIGNQNWQKVKKIRLKNVNIFRTDISTVFTLWLVSEDISVKVGSFSLMAENHKDFTFDLLPVFERLGHTLDKNVKVVITPNIEESIIRCDGYELEI